MLPASMSRKPVQCLFRVASQSRINRQSAGISQPNTSIRGVTLSRRAAPSPQIQIRRFCRVRRQTRGQCQITRHPPVVQLVSPLISGLQRQRGVMRQPRLQLHPIPRVSGSGQRRDGTLQARPVVMCIGDQASQEPGRICSSRIVTTRETGCNPVGVGKIVQPEQRDRRYQVEIPIDHTASGQFNPQLVRRPDRIVRPPLRQLSRREVEAGVRNRAGIIARACTSQRCAELRHGLARFFLAQGNVAGMVEPGQCLVLGIFFRS